MLCPCGSQKKFSDCCEAILLQKKSATTSEELMRSRYTAYSMGNGKYLVDTTYIDNRVEEDAQLIVENAKNIDWLKLEIVESHYAQVEFKAYYKDVDNTIHLHHEKSLFVYDNSQWYYKEGTLYTTAIRRNEPCPCGSQKKYKKCCFKN